MVSVEITNWAAPGSVVGSLYGINNESGVNYDIPLRDSGLVRTMTGSYPWKISNDFTTVVYITNISDQEAQFVGEVNSHGTKVALDPRKLRPGETAVFDMQEFRDERTADASGNKLSRDVSQGQFKWSIFGVTNGKLLLIGRAEMVSRSQHISTSYSCNDPCPPYIYSWIDPLEPFLAVSESSNSSAWQMAQYDSGYSMGPYTGYPGWSLDNTSAASMDPDSGHTISVIGENADIGGDFFVTADFGCQERYSWDGQNCYDNNFQDCSEDSSSFKVAGVSNAAMVEVGHSYPDGTADFQTISPCNVSCKASGLVRIQRACGGLVQYEYRKEYWVRYEPFGPTVCLGPLKTVSYSGTCHPIDCFDTTLAP